MNDQSIDPENVIWMGNLPKRLADHALYESLVSDIQKKREAAPEEEVR